MSDHISKVSSLLTSRLEGKELSPADQQYLDEWLAASPGNRDLLSKLDDPAYLREELQKMVRYDAEASWNKIQPAPAIGRQRWKYWTAAAAVLLAIAGVGYYLLSKPPKPVDLAVEKPANDVAAPAQTKATITLHDGRRITIDSVNTGTMVVQGDIAVQKTAGGQIVYSGDGSAPQPVGFNILSNPRGSGVISLVLSDGTKVWLNADSEIRYPVSFQGDLREVQMQGEAFFEVARNEKQPFVVTANGTVVQVTGTHFNVNAYQEEASLKVTLLEGGVKVSKNQQTVLLAPGQQAQVSDHINIDKSADTEQVMAWKNGYFSFKGADIYTAMRQMSRWYDVDVQFNDNITELFYGDISRDKNISSVLKMLETTGSVRFTTKGKLIEVNK
ncbi:MAG: FecR domain-containing protein [Bacteroidetes bacterium]|nr:FecR domain-containing protein [Bacteroidota bacterium]